MTPVRVGMHRLALELGMTVGQLRCEMTAREYLDWLEFYQHESKHKDKSVEIDMSDPASVAEAFRL